MPNLADDDLRKWEYSLHTSVKHRILSRYIGPWASILGRWHKTLAYVDGFAGRGRYSQGEAGSPLLVIDSAIDRMNRYPGSPERLDCHFVEANDNNRKNLETELAQYPGAHDPRITYKVYPGQFADVCPSIVSSLAASGQPSFFFVDPFGFDDTPMTSLEAIVRLDRSELLINLMTSFIVRAFGRLAEAGMVRTLDQVFGSHAWQTIANSTSMDRDKQLADLYGRSLKSIGIKYAVPFPMGDEEDQRIIYYLIHATKHPLGARIMKDEMIKAGTPGQIGFTFEAARKLTLMLNYDVERLPQLLMDNFVGQTVTFINAVYQTLEDSGACKLEDYRTTIKGMESAQRVKVTRPPMRASSTGLEEDDLIEFIR